MAICPELVHKWEMNAAACGLGNPKHIAFWRSVAIEISEKYSIHIDLVYLLFKKSASLKLKPFKQGSDVWNYVICQIGEAIKRNEDVTTKRVESWLIEAGVPLKVKTVSPGKVAKRFNLPDDLIQTGSIKTKIHALKQVLTPGQISILNDIMVKHNHDDELGALSLALIWAAERMKDE